MFKIHKIFGDAVTAGRKVLSEEHKISFAASLRSRRAGPLFLLDSKLPNKEKNCARNDEMFVRRSETRYFSY